MRIAQVGSIWENTPPPGYGGTERIVSYLTEQLVKAGHDVTLFACGTSQTRAKLVATYPRPAFRDGVPWTNILYPLLHLTEAFDRAEQFDILHVHLNKSSDYLALPLARPIAHKVVFTLHFPYPASQGRLDRHAVFQKYKELHYISISQAQRQGGENLNWLATVYNGIDLAAYTLNRSPKPYFMWLGKFNPDKGVVEAIQAAKLAQVKLILAGKIDQLEEEDKQYFEQQVQPLIDGEQITYIGELTDQQKNQYLGQARGFLNPIKWNEPFGLTMIEAMATGTPVIAFAQGSAPEVVADGVTGYLVDDVQAMAARLKDIHQLSREACRQRVEEQFSATRMTAGYLAAYQKILAL